ncbi:Uncharacterised protein [Escherichia coli]|nr:Uncharacterised protein [Escherichia coli]
MKNIRHDTLLFDLRVHFLHRNYFFGRVGIQRHRGSETTVQGGVINALYIAAHCDGSRGSLQSRDGLKWC